MRGARAFGFVALIWMSTGCDQYTETTNSDFFVLFGNGLADAVNNTGGANVAAAPPLPTTEYFNDSVACQRGARGRRLASLVAGTTTNTPRVPNLAGWRAATGSSSVSLERLVPIQEAARANRVSLTNFRT